jgi:hypothetical protein
MAITMSDKPEDVRCDREAIGERRLMAAVLEDALAVLATAARTPSDRRLQAETWNWIMAYDREWPFSFDNVCESLDLDPDTLRTRVQQLESATVSRGWQRSHRENAPAPRQLRLVS